MERLVESHGTIVDVALVTTTLERRWESDSLSLMEDPSSRRTKLTA